LVIDRHGALYGTTRFAGMGYGTVYKLTPTKGGKQWVETVLYAFTGKTDGANP
jgi:hypothetical protein